MANELYYKNGNANSGNQPVAESTVTNDKLLEVVGNAIIKDGLANIIALPRVSGNLYYATDIHRLFLDDGTTIIEVTVSYVRTSNPTINDDSSNGFRFSDIWVNSSTEEAFICLNQTTGAAVWKSITSSSGGGGLNGFETRFDSDTTPPPSTGRTKFNSPDYSLVTEIYVSKETNSGEDISNLFPFLVTTGSSLLLQESTNASNYASFDVLSSVVDSGTYFTITVSHVSSSGTLPTAVNTPVSFIINSVGDTSNYVLSVNAGANVEVNNSNPQNPIVSAFPTTTAGILSRTYFTGDTETLGAGTFYKSNRDGKGTVGTVTQTVNVNDNEKAFFAQDLISEPYPIDTTIYAGAYSGILNGFVNSNSGEQRFTVEIYKTDLDGNPIPSGIAGAPTGDLGVTVIAIAQSGLIDLQSGNESQFAITAELEADLSLLTTNRVRYHVSAEKVGTTGGVIDISTSYGNTHIAHLDVPVQSLTSTTINDDLTEFPSSATQYDINRNIKTNVDTNTINIGILDNDTVKIATTATDSVKGALYFKDDAASSTLTISTSPIV